MGTLKRLNFLHILIILAVVCVFAISYNISVRSTVVTLTSYDRDFLQSVNDELAVKLASQESTDDWDEILFEYDEVGIRIQDSHGNEIVRKRREKSSNFDVRVRTPFEYKGDAYLITSGIYLFRDIKQTVLEFVLIESTIGVAALVLIISLIYALMLRPFRRFYMMIEEYEKSGDYGKYKFRGYIGKVYARFVKLTQNLEDQQQRQRRIIASISHDIKTPLTSIMGYAERLKRDNISPERRERYLDTVYGKSLEIRSLVDEFDEYLSYNMLQNIKTTTITTKELCDEIISEYADELESEGVDFKIECESKTALIRVDLIKIKRVFGNLIVNSLKHFDKPEKKIIIRVESRKNKVIIMFGDNGAGVDPDKYELIFEPLYTSDEGRKVAGLGLAICREIIQSHDGKIYARTSSLGGLEVCIELNRAKMYF